MGPLVSVVLPTYNRADVLDRAIDSVLSQTYENIELVVVDDGSTDGTQDLLESIDDPRLEVVVNEENRGQCDARNEGKAAANGSLLAYIDSDAVWRPRKLEEQVRAYRGSDDGDRDTVVFCVNEIHTKDRTVEVPDPDELTSTDDLFLDLIQGTFIDTSTLLVPTKLVEEVGGWDPKVDRLADWDLVLRLAKRARFAFVDEPLVESERREDSITNTHPAVPSYRRILSKHPGASQHGLPLFAGLLTREGHHLIRDGETERGRRYLLEAIRHEPTAHRLGMLAASAPGPWFYRRIHRGLKMFRDVVGRVEGQ